jgi:hypothetical protein
MLTYTGTAHPQKRMKDLGITYVAATPQSVADQWWFWGCDNLPNPLPEYLKAADNLDSIASDWLDPSELEALRGPAQEGLT